MAEAKDDVDLAVANMQIEALQRTMTQEEKRQSIENELKKIKSESTVTINGDGFKANHKGYEFEISDTGEISISEPFEASEWDKTAVPEDVFIWASDDPTSEDYGKVVGYKANVENYSVLRYPSRCTSVGVDFDSIAGTDEEREEIRSYTKNIKKVELPETVKEINIGAFGYGGGYYGYYFTGMKETNIPDGVTSIGNNAFSGCTGLSSITIPDGVTSIDYMAFSDCTGLSGIRIPDSVTSIGGWAFFDCTSLSSITIPDSVTSIGSNAFHNCTSLSSVTIPDSVTSIGGGAFHNCTNLSSITIPDSVTSIANAVFSHCTSLNSIAIPNSITSIGQFAFSDCTSLSSVTIPDSVTSIGGWAFENCTNLSSITIPRSVTSIESYAFNNVTHIEYHGTATGSPWGAKSIN